MKNAKRCAYAQIIRWRIRLGWALLALMLLYMVIAAEMGGGDSRVVTDLMDMVGDVIFFGGLVFILVRIAHNKRLLRDRARLREEEIRERDERNARQLLEDGWTLLVVWECQLKRGRFDATMARVVAEVRAAGEGRLPAHVVDAGAPPVWRLRAVRARRRARRR